MKIFALMLCAVSFSASADEITELKARIDSLEKRMREVERYAVGGLTDAEQQELDRKNTENEPKIMAANLRANKFLKEHFGVCIGDNLTSVTNGCTESHGDSSREDLHNVRIRKPNISARYDLRVLKKYGYFDKAYALVDGDRVYGIGMVAEFEKRFSNASIDAEVKRTCRQLIDEFGYSAIDGVTSSDAASVLLSSLGYRRADGRECVHPYTLHSTGAGGRLIGGRPLLLDRGKLSASKIRCEIVIEDRLSMESRRISEYEKDEATKDTLVPANY